MAARLSIYTYVICLPDNSIYSVRRSPQLPSRELLALTMPAGGFFIDITGKGSFDAMDILDIHDKYVANAEKDGLVLSGHGVRPVQGAQQFFEAGSLLGDTITGIINSHTVISEIVSGGSPLPGRNVP